MKLALHEFGVPEFDRSMLTIKGNVFRIGRAPLRIEVINEISGVEFDDAFSNKSSTGRTKDKADLEELRKFLG